MGPRPRSELDPPRKRAALTVPEDVPVPLHRTRLGLDSRPEPLVVVTGVVGDDIDDDLNVLLLESGHHGVELGQGTDTRVDVSVVGNIICLSACLRAS